MTHEPGPDLYIALVAIGYADGDLDDDEASAILRAAQRLSPEDFSKVLRATQTPIAIEEVVADSDLSELDRRFLYAVACWIAAIDGEVVATEKTALRRLGDILELPLLARQEAAAAARHVATLPEGDRVTRYDLKGLRREIVECLT